MDEPRLECVTLPSAEEIRMVRAIALLALLEAVRDGASRSSFRRFHVHAARVASTSAAVQVELCVSYGTRLLQRSVIALQDDELPGLTKQHIDRTDAGEIELILHGVVIWHGTMLWRTLDV